MHRLQEGELLLLPLLTARIVESVGLAAALLFSGSGISPALDSISCRLGREDSSAAFTSFVPPSQSLNFSPRSLRLLYLNK